MSETELIEASSLQGGRDSRFYRATCEDLLKFAAEDLLGENIKLKPYPETDRNMMSFKNSISICVLNREENPRAVGSVVIPYSQSSDKLCYASIERNILVISPHCYFNEMDFIKSLSSALKMFCHNEIKNEAHIMAMIQCDPSEIEAELDKNEVSRYDPTFLKETKYHEIGDETQLETLLLENCLVILNFSIGEKAYYYDCGNALNIAAVRDVHHCDENFWESTVTLEVRSENLDDDHDEENAVICVSPFFIFKLLTPSEHILLFSDDQESSSARATAEPVHLADIRPEEDNITEFLTSPFFCDTTRAQVAMIMTRLICHLHYRLSRESKSTLLLGTKMIKFLQHFSALDVCDISANEILRIALSLRPVSVEIPIQEYTSDWYTCSVGHTHMPQVGTHLQAPPPQRRNQQPMNYQPRFQPRQRRGYQTQHSYRFQPQVTSAEPQKPPTSDKDAQIWLDQAKADYRAAAYLMEGMTITPTVVPRPQECQIFSDNEEGEEGMEATYNEQDETNLESASSSESVVESMEEYERGGQLLEQNSPQFPYLVCFLCHEAVEKCLKGVLYAYCGLKPELLNCSSLVFTL